MFNDKILSNIKTYFLVLLIFFFFIIITIPSFKIDAALKDPTPKKDIEKKIIQLFNSLTLEEKVGQLFVVGGNWRNPQSFTMITRCHFGNAFLSKNDVLDMTPDQVATLTNQLQEKALKQNQIPMLIFIDQEGGLVNRLKNKFKTFPSQEQMAKETPVMMEQAARITAKQLNAVGINVNLAPVIDVGYNRASHIFKSHRSFSDNPQKVTQCAKIYIRSFLEEQIIACVKHFPNDGDLDEDPHYGLPVNRKSKEELLNTSLVPYRELNHDGLLRMLMISHVLVPALEPDPNIPVSLSKNTIENFLRKELGFQGLVVTDVMNMKALGEGKFLTEQQIRDKVVKAVEAGANLLLFAGPVREQIAAYEELVNAFKENRLSIDWLNETVIKIIELKLDLLKND